jgi:hypothetical protein
VYFRIEAFRWRIAVKAKLKGVTEMVGVGWLPPQPSPTIDDVSTPILDRALAIVILSHILRSV